MWFSKFSSIVTIILMNPGDNSTWKHIQLVLVHSSSGGHRLNYNASYCSYTHHSQWWICKSSVFCNSSECFPQMQRKNLIALWIWFTKSVLHFVKLIKWFSACREKRIRMGINSWDNSLKVHCCDLNTTFKELLKNEQIFTCLVTLW